MSINSHFKIVISSLQELAHLLDSASCVQALVSPIPPVIRGMEKEPIDHIELSHLSGKAAVASACAIFNDLHIHNDFSQKSARRMPGVLWLSPASLSVSDKIVSTIDLINQSKAAIEHEITQKYASRQQRFEALRVISTGVMTLHLYRQIRCFRDSDVTSVRFSWLRKDVVSKVDKDKLLNELGAEQARLGDDGVRLKLLINKIISTPEPLLRYRREIKVQPVANMTIGGRAKTVTATMPIIILQSSPLTIKPLSTFESDVKRTTRSDKARSEMIGRYNGASIEVITR